MIGEKNNANRKGIFAKEKMLEASPDDWRTKAFQGVIFGNCNSPKKCVKGKDLPGQPVGGYAQVSSKFARKMGPSTLEKSDGR